MIIEILITTLLAKFLQHPRGDPGFYWDRVRCKPGTQKVLSPKTCDQSQKAVVLPCGGTFTDRCRWSTDSPYTTSHRFKENKLLEKCPYQDQAVTNKFLAKTNSIRNNAILQAKRNSTARQRASHFESKRPRGELLSTVFFGSQALH